MQYKTLISIYMFGAAFATHNQTSLWNIQCHFTISDHVCK